MRDAREERSEKYLSDEIMGYARREENRINGNYRETAIYQKKKQSVLERKGEDRSTHKIK